MKEFILATIYSAPVSMIMLAVLGWLLRNWITSRLSSSISNEYAMAFESHKAILKKEIDTELVRLTAEQKSKFETELETYRASLRLKVESELGLRNADVQSRVNIQLESHKADLKTRMEAELEAMKGRIQNRFYFSKSQFDMELAFFKELWASSSALIDDTARILLLYDQVEKDGTNGIKRKHAESADSSFFSSHTLVLGSRPFIPLPVYEKSLTLVNLCKKEINTFFTMLVLEERNEFNDRREVIKDARKSLIKIKDLWAELADLIRERLLNPSIISDNVSDKP